MKGEIKMIKLESDQTYLWQWDIGQRLIVSYPSGTVMDFSNGGASAVRRNVYNGGSVSYVDIPNALLQNAGQLYIYTYSTESDRATTVLKTVYPIRSKPKPPDYVSPDEEALFWHQLDDRLTRLEESGAGGSVPYTIGAGLKLVSDGVRKTLVTDTSYLVQETINALPKYNGAHIVTPQAGSDSVLKTNGKILLDDITVRKVPYFETSNDYGETVYIATESEVNYGN